MSYFRHPFSITSWLNSAVVCGRVTHDHLGILPCLDSNLPSVWLLCSFLLYLLPLPHCKSPPPTPQKENIFNGVLFFSALDSSFSPYILSEQTGAWLSSLFLFTWGQSLPHMLACLLISVPTGPIVHSLNHLPSTFSHKAPSYSLGILVPVLKQLIGQKRRQMGRQMGQVGVRC